MSVANLADCTAILGKSGSGKSTIIKRQIAKAKPKRLVVWSPDEDEDHYEKLGCILVRSVTELGRLMQGMSFKIVYWPSMDEKKRQTEFAYFCKLVFAAKNLWCLVEELRYVTKPSYAPEPWAILSTRGRKKGIVLIGTSQRPAQIDKDFLGNCTEIYCGALKYPADRKACAMTMNVPESDLAALLPLHFVKVDDHNNRQNLKITF